MFILVRYTISGELNLYFMGCERRVIRYMVYGIYMVIPLEADGMCVLACGIVEWKV